MRGGDHPVELPAAKIVIDFDGLAYGTREDRSAATRRQSPDRYRHVSGIA